MNNHILSVQKDNPDKNIKSDLIEIRQNNVKLMIHDMLQYIHSDIKLLDIGSGDGNLTKYICSQLNIKDFKCYDITPPDQNKMSMSTLLLKHNDNIPIHIFNGINIPEQNNSYDIVSSIFVLHHAGESQIKLLEDMIRISHKYLIILEDLNESQFIDRNKLHDKNGIFRTNREWIQLWEKYNLKLLNHNYCNNKDSPQYYYILMKQ